MVEDFLEFSRSLDALVCGQVSLATQIEWHHRGAAIRVRHSYGVAISRFSIALRASPCWSAIAALIAGRWKKRTSVALREPFVQVMGDFLRLRRITREGQCQRRPALDV